LWRLSKEGRGVRGFRETQKEKEKKRKEKYLVRGKDELDVCGCQLQGRISG